MWHMESILKYLGTGLFTLCGGLFVLWGQFQYEWLRPCVAILVLVLAFLCLSGGIYCFIRAMVLTKRREYEEERRRGIIF